MNLDALTITMLIVIAIAAFILANSFLGSVTKSLMAAVCLIVTIQALIYIYRVTKL